MRKFYLYIQAKTLGYLAPSKNPRSVTSNDHNPQNRSCWLIELARKLPSACILDGFDISPSQFPAKEYLPRNISLHIADAFAEAPESLLGKYDVVHVRSLTLVVKGGDPKPLLRILKRMLSTSILGQLEAGRKRKAQY